MPQLLDYSQIAISAVTGFSKDLKGDPNKINDLIRHVCLSSILGHKKRFGKKYGNIIITTDSNHGYWRKDVFPFYKANRKKSREASDLDWKMIFDTINEIKNDLIEYFPYPVVNVDKAEADDIIGVLTKYFQDNDLIASGLFEEPQPIMIVSADGDHAQLQKWKNVSQYSPMQRKMIKPSNPMNSLIEKICSGDSGDGIPNICSPDDVFVTEGRQKSFKKIRFNDFFERGIDGCNTDEERRNFSRNETMISYEKIPSDLQEKIINEYKKVCVKQNSPGKIREYLIKHRCRNLMDSISDF